jgi:hypothetical protein
MGHRYGTVLERMHAPYRYLDLTEKSFDQTIRFTKKDKISDFSHVIITTPIDTHYNVYQEVKESIPDEKILIVKPVINSAYQLSLLDKNVFHGMIERYNQAFLVSQGYFKHRDMDGIRFDRYVPNKRKHTDVILDLAIHDFDLLEEMGIRLANLENVSVHRNHNLYSISAMYEDILIQFNGGFMSSSNQREMTLIFEGAEESVKVDLYNQEIIYYNDNVGYLSSCMEKEKIFMHRDPLEQQIRDFLTGKKSNAKEAHVFMLKCLNMACDLKHG